MYFREYNSCLRNKDNANSRVLFVLNMQQTNYIFQLKNITSYSFHLVASIKTFNISIIKSHKKRISTTIITRGIFMNKKSKL